MARFAMLAFCDVLITPYTDLVQDRSVGGEYHRGGPHWPEWSTQTAARHCQGGVPIDAEPAKAEPAFTLADTVAWGGAIVWHFGHQIADFGTRLLPTLAEMPDVRFAFSMRARRPLHSMDETPAYFREILDWWGIAGERVDLIAQPTLMERIVVAPQGEQQGGPGPEPWYLDLLDAHMNSRLGEVERSGSLYVSRAGQRGRFAGESYLETLFEEAGFRVLRPETVALEEQMRAYAGSESIIFAEGSALHGAQLLGRLGDVTVLARRPGHRQGEALMSPRALSLRYVDAVRGLVHGLTVTGQPALPFGLSILDPDVLLAALPLREAWDQKAFATAQDADVEAWLRQEQAMRSWAVPGSAELIAETLRAAGLSPSMSAPSP